jgi:Outer membrane protein beta-barrel domain
MKKNLQIGLILGMVILSEISFGQTNELKAEKNKSVRVTETYLDLVLNVVGTNLNYGKSNDVLSDYKKAVLGAQVGVSLQAGITPHVSLVSEFYFFMKGGELKANNPLTTSNTNIRLYTLELPVLARVHFGRFHLNAGPSIAYNFYGSQKNENSTSDLAFNNSAESFKRWEAGLQMGGGYTFHTKKKTIRLDVRYNYGLTNIANSGEMYNRSLILALHFAKPWKTNPLGKRHK